MSENLNWLQGKIWQIRLVDLEDVILSEISQRKTNSISLHLYVESQNKTKQKQAKNNQIHRNQTCAYQSWREEKLEEEGQKVHSYKINKY